VSLRTPDQPTEPPSSVDRVAAAAQLSQPAGATGAAGTATAAGALAGDRPAQAAEPPEACGPAIPTALAAAAQRPLPPGGVRLTEGLLHDWQRRNAAASMPLALRQLVVAGNLDNIRLAIRASTSTSAASSADGDGARYWRSRDLGPVEPVPGLGYHGPVFMDSDIYKTLEAIGWELANDPSPDSRTALSDFADTAIDLLAKAQRPDGYLNSYVQASGEPRYSRLAVSHEMYCAGHLIQAAIALWRGAGDARLLAIATRFADQLVSEFAGLEKGLDGHPIIETALAELYRETGTRAYLDLASQFVEQRGHGLAGDSGLGRRYLQDHMPVRESPTEVGHAVRALYLEAGVTDVATETRDAELLESSVRRWDDMVAAKTALTGGNGSRHIDEGFGDRFELPPDRGYNETCAAIASFQWSWRLLLATGDPKYADLMERVLHNGFAGSVSAAGDRFFYVNPLQRRPDHFEKDDPGRRREWFTCACCPPNIMRLLASLHHYLATVDGDTLYIQQYAAARVAAAGLELEIVTGYPWSGEVTLRILAAPPAARELALRIPAGSPAAGFTINNHPERPVATHRGYLRLRERWRPGDVVTLRLEVTPRWTYPDRRADALRGCAAIERGPLVYCFEQADQPVPLDELTVRRGSPLAERAATADGIGRTVQVTADAGAGVPAVAIPYFQWDNRGPGAMRVWVPAADR
jgi:uncharacterized protein